ncbi:universal stress protein [Haloarcula sp. JP-L23]|uniref:universal stress protein n=1 Tax=Haloarcula sp. JP-L23 TaxID=2716717 RepID=UPI00140EE499|nr:universal stress protein [Haloarcula sp. JP-L23]
MYEHILIPYDGSAESKKGATHGIELAAELGSTVHALYVMDLPGVPRAMSIRDDEESVREEYEKYGQKTLDEIAEVAAEYGVECEQALRTGTPSEEIVDYAEEKGLDVIVMGSAYRGKIGTILGGTTDKVVRTATVPVITQRMEMDELS